MKFSMKIGVAVVSAAFGERHGKVRNLDGNMLIAL